jgi:hypothetical protein
MRVPFRQGIVNAQPDFLNFISPNVWIRTTDSPTFVTIAHGTRNYIHYENTDVQAWNGPFTTTTHYWLYWDFNSKTFERTFGYTTLAPIISATTPTSALDSQGFPGTTIDRHWFNTLTNVMSVYDGSGWRQVIRVFAAQFYNGSFTSLSINAPDFRGTQIGNTFSVPAGRVVFDENGHTIVRDDHTFFTTEDKMFASGARVDGVRLESNVSVLKMYNSVSAFSVVALSSDVGFGKARTAIYEDVGVAAIAMVTQDVVANDIGAVIFQGVVTNVSWNWDVNAIGKPLWVDNGQLTLIDPFELSPTSHPYSKVPVGRVIANDTIIFEQGLGQKGDKGDPGSGSTIVPHATTTVYGEVKLVTAEPNSLVVSDSDPRLVDARIPTAHTHPANQITFTPGHNVSGTDVQTAVEFLGDSVLFKSGGTMTGALLLASDPTVSLQAASKHYVDSKVFGLIWLDPIYNNSLISDVLVSPPASPNWSDSYIVAAGAAGLWTGLSGHIVTWNGTSWHDDGLLSALPIGTRFGIAFESSTTPSGSFTGKANEIAILGVGPAWTYQTPIDGNAVYVNNPLSLHSFHQYAYSATTVKWVEFGGSVPIPKLIELQDVTIVSPNSGQVLSFNGATWDNATLSIPSTLDNLTDATITSPTNNQVLQYNGSQWVNNTLTLTTTLDGLTDATITSPTNNQVLQFNGSQWVNNTLSIPTLLDDLIDVIISVPTTNQFLQFNGTNWVNTSVLIPTVLDDLSDTIITTAVSGNVLQFNGTNWVNNTLSIPTTLDDLSDTIIASPLINQVLKYTGVNWTNATLSIPTTLNDLSDVVVVAPTDGSILYYTTAAGHWDNVVLNQAKIAEFKNLPTLTQGSILVWDPAGYQGWGNSNTTAIDLAGQTVRGAAFVQYSELLTSANVSVSSTSVNLDTANTHEITLTTNVTTFSITGTFVPNRVYSLTLIVKQDAVGARTITWPASFKWDNATPAVLTTTANAIDIFTIISTDAGTTWYAFAAGRNMS